MKRALKVWGTFLVLIIAMALTKDKETLTILNGMLCGICAYSTACLWFGKE